MALLDRCIFIPTTDGSGDFQVVNAVQGYQTPGQAGAVNGASYPYAAENRNSANAIIEWEVGIGTWTSATSTLTRTTVLFSSNSNGKVNFSAPPHVIITPLAETLDFGVAPTTYYVSSAGADTNPGSQALPWKTITKVNAASLNPGDSVLFAGGQTFSGAIVCPSSGTASNPITFGSYGGGQATISSGNSNGFTSTSQAGIIVRDLTFSGSASTNNGILFQNTGAKQLQNIQAINCNVSGYGHTGIFVNGSSTPVGYDDVLIQGCTVTGCCGVANGGSGSMGLTSGIQVTNDAGAGLKVNPASFNNVLISNCVSYSNLGCADTAPTGNGIYVAECNNGHINECLAYSNGGSSTSTNGPAAIWLFDSNQCVISNCISHHQGSASGHDGQGFDLDTGCTSCIVINCYSHDNAGTGFLCDNDASSSYNSNTGCQFINCVSENDCLTNGFGCISIINVVGITGISIMGCTVYNSSTTAAFSCRGTNASGTTGIVSGNTFIVTGTQVSADSTGNPTGLVLQGNKYLGNYADFKVTWNGSTYTDITSWNFATGNETYTAPNAPQMNAAYFSCFSASGNGQGYFSRVNGDTNDRLALQLDTSNNPLLAFGPGNSGRDTGISRGGAATLNFGNGTAGDGSATLNFALGVLNGNTIKASNNQNNFIEMASSAFGAGTYTVIFGLDGGFGAGGTFYVSSIGIFNTRDIQYAAQPVNGGVVMEGSTGGTNAGIGLYLGTSDATAIELYVNRNSSLKTVGKITAAGSFILQANGALATNATDGFTYIPTCAGQPTGTPTAVTGAVPIVWDTTNHKFWVYDGAWKGGTNPGVWT